MSTNSDPYWIAVWKRFKNHRLGVIALCVVVAFCTAGIYAPFLASSKPLFVWYDNAPYFPLFRYLFYHGFYSKNLDIFFNIMILTTPLFFISYKSFKGRTRVVLLSLVSCLQLFIFLYLIYVPVRDPAANQELTQKRMEAVKAGQQLTWDDELNYMNSYEKLNLILRYKQRKAQQEALEPYAAAYFAATDQNSLPTLWQVERENEAQEMKRYEAIIQNDQNQTSVQKAKTYLTNLLERQRWLAEQSANIKIDIMPLLSPYHWEDDAGGQQALNRYIPWEDLTRVNRKDLISALIFGIRISLVVGLAAVALALAIGIPIGALAGYYGGAVDIVVCRMLEVWESMPTLFVLLLAVSMIQSKSIFLVIAIVGIFGWTGFSRYIRGEFLKQRNLPYVEACHALGFKDQYIIFKHILPNAIPPVLTLLPFAIMGAISSEAGLSFLGLGEENSCSWGVLMDEGRSVFPEESYLLWPPALALTTLLIAIAILGDSLRDVIDPKFQR